MIAWTSKSICSCFMKNCFGFAPAMMTSCRFDGYSISHPVVGDVERLLAGHEPVEVLTLIELAHDPADLSAYLPQHRAVHFHVVELAEVDRLSDAQRHPVVEGNGVACLVEDGVVPEATSDERRDVREVDLLMHDDRKRDDRHPGSQRDPREPGVEREDAARPVQLDNRPVALREEPHDLPVFCSVDKRVDRLPGLLASGDVERDPVAAPGDGALGVPHHDHGVEDGLPVVAYDYRAALFGDVLRALRVHAQQSGEHGSHGPLDEVVDYELCRVHSTPPA